MVFHVVETAKARFPGLVVREWDLGEHPEIGPRYGVLATPAIIVNGRLEFRRVPKEQAFLDRLAAIAGTHGD